MTGLDTETHEGRAVLIATPRMHVVFPTTFGQCVSFLVMAAGEDHKFACWNADYDVAAMLKFLPPQVLERLFKMERWSFEEPIQGYRQPVKLTLQYIPKKFLRIWIGGKSSKRRQRQKRIEIYDLQQFYNMSLNRAAKQELGIEKLDPGVPWSELAHQLRTDMAMRQKLIDYCTHDAYLVDTLAERTREKFAKININFERPVSCATLSYRAFKPQLADFKISKELNTTARESFRGGMIECLRAGFFKDAYYIDLRSAYPSAIRELVDMPKVWLPIENSIDPGAQYASVDCAVTVPHSWSKGPIPYVPAGLMSLYPTGDWRTWLDLYSFREMERRGLIMKIFGGVQGVGYSTHRPFAEDVERLYLARARDAQQKWAVKIILNALYGKLAETKRYRVPDDPEALWDMETMRLKFEGRERFLPHTNFFMAAEITSRTRWRLIADIDPKDVIFYATDGVFLSRKPESLDFGEKLGQWSPPERVRDLVVVGSGVYCYRYEKDGEWHTTTRFRGFASDLDLYRLLDCRKHLVPIELQRNQKLGATIATQRWERFNVIHMVGRELNVNFDRKRRWERKWSARDLLHSSFRSEPWRLFDETLSDEIPSPHRGSSGRYL